jgi:D-glycero-alpha-D-manno-heptose-7-phosphate kinase
LIISQTPMRISFAGGGSDLEAYYQNDFGAVVSAAIDKYVYVIVNKKFDDYIRVGYSTTELVHEVDDIQHNLIREAMKVVGGIGKGIDIVYLADVLPLDWGTGLGVSSSITVGVLNALYCFKGEKVSAEKLARQACEIEINVLGAPIGKQDQYAVSYGGANFLKFHADGSVFVEPISLSKSYLESTEKDLILFYTNLASNSQEVLSDQKRNTLNSKNVIRSLDNMTNMAVELRNELLNETRHVLGGYLSKGWEMKKGLARDISNSEIDKYYDIGMSIGARGGKILGSGGGGFLLFDCPQALHNKLKLSIPLKSMPLKISSTGSRILDYSI